MYTINMIFIVVLAWFVFPRTSLLKVVREDTNHGYKILTTHENQLILIAGGNEFWGITGW